MQKQIVRRAKVDDNHLPNNIHPLIKQIYASRGIESATELELNVSKLCAIESLKGINQGCHILHQALIDNKNIAIIGYASRVISEHLTPKLTTIDQHGKKVGITSAKLLLKRLDKFDGEFESIIVNSTVQKRFTS